MSAADSSSPVVVVGVDGSAESRAALAWAASYAAATSARVTALSCWHDPAAAIAPAGEEPPAITGEMRARLEEMLSNAVSEAFGAASAGLTTKVAYGHPAQVLVDSSRAADLLVVGRRGHGAFTGMMLGSVSIHCVTAAHCPVVVVQGS